MKKILSKIFGKQRAAEQPTVQPVKPVTGITKEEYDQIYSLLCTEYSAAGARQTTSKTPSAYMRGIRKAMTIVEGFVPHAINN